MSAYDEHSIVISAHAARRDVIGHHQIQACVLHALFSPRDQLLLANTGLSLEAHYLEVRIRIPHSFDDLSGRLEPQNKLLPGLDLLSVFIQCVIRHSRCADQCVIACLQLCQQCVKHLLVALSIDLAHRNVLQEAMNDCHICAPAARLQGHSHPGLS